MKNSTAMNLPAWVYILDWIFFAYLFVVIISIPINEQSNLIVIGIQFIDFGVHEASHIIVMFLPPIMVAAAGSIGEILFTFLILFATLKTKAYFASVFAGLWVMIGMHSAGLYMADARSQSLPLIGPGEAVQHDWHFVFGQLGWLNNDGAIGGAVTTIGTSIGAVALVFGMYLIILKVTTSPTHW